MTKPKTVTVPHPNTRKRVNRNGEYPWLVTVREGSLIQGYNFYDRTEAYALFNKAVKAGFREV